MTQRTKRMTAAAALATLIAVPAEGLRQYAYYDPPGVLTVCYGSTEKVVKGRFYSLQECRQRLTDDMLTAVTTVERCVPGLPENVLAAFADATYNLGPTLVCDAKASTAARLLREGRITQACNQLPRWNKARIAGAMIELPGLTKRRELERQLCLSPQAVGGVSWTLRPQQGAAQFAMLTCSLLPVNMLRVAQDGNQPGQDGGSAQEMAHAWGWPGRGGYRPLCPVGG